ncbi:MAG: nicotinate-nucleotide--dimethylbenzimidazole phosphoribosyltransferase [Actinomycetota bacterium]|nr:nicotinate-nucleotide--dimethylbenzimidazole phosphoribosyltransferase [Actinomycetota bacterium]
MAFEDRAKELAGDVIPPDEGAAERAGERHLALAKPPGSLGVIEDLGAKLAAISGKMPPPVPENAAGVVCAGDHGVLKRGVSPWPREVTAAMVAKAGPKSPESG